MECDQLIWCLGGFTPYQLRSALDDLSQSSLPLWLSSGLATRDTAQDLKFRRWNETTAITPRRGFKSLDCSVAHTPQAPESRLEEHGVKLQMISIDLWEQGRPQGSMASRNNPVRALEGNFHTLSAGTTSLPFFGFPYLLVEGGGGSCPPSPKGKTRT